MAKDRAADYRPPYENVEHEKLWNDLNPPAGDPEQVDGLSTKWSQPIKSTLDDFVLDLDRDLTDLAETWGGAGGHEYKRRLDLVVKFADELSKHVSIIKENLDAWSGFLREAQQNAPDPADTDDNGRTAAGAAIGAAVAGPAGALVGGMIGHSQDEEQKNEARGQIIDIIAKLAMQYSTNDNFGDPPPAPPSDLPDSSNAGSPAMRSLYKGDVPVADGFAAPPKDTGTGPGDSSSPTTTGNPSLSSSGNSHLLGAGPGTLTGISAGTTGSLGLAGGGAMPSVPGGGGGPGLLAGGLPPGTSPRGISHNSLEHAKPGSGNGPAKPGAKPVQGKGVGRPGTGAVTEDDEGDSDVYETWLTEDDMVWGTESDAAPISLTVRRPDEELPQSAADRSTSDGAEQAAGLASESGGTLSIPTRKSATSHGGEPPLS